MASPLHIAYCTSEMAPFAKTGGLADVSAALPKALVRLGHKVTVFLPRYAGLTLPEGSSLELCSEIDVPVRGEDARARLGPRCSLCVARLHALFSPDVFSGDRMARSREIQA